jgi:apolipoprotein N-acyltransferase
MSDSAGADPAVGGAPDQPVPPAQAPALPVALGRPVSLLLALASGGALTLAFPGFNVWPLAPIAVAGLALATRGHRARFGALAGFLFGLAFFVPHLQWSGIYVGPLPWFALATAEAAFLAGLGALLPRIWRVPGGSAGTALAGAGLWVLQEAARDRLPFGGFPWGRLVFSQAEAPTAGLAALGGAPLVTATVAAIGTLLAVAVVGLAPRRSSSTAARRPSAATAVTALVVAGVLTGGGLLVPLPTDGESARVAAVQGNTPRAGLDFNAERRAVLDNHANATLDLAARVKAGTAPQPDLVIWPENASDIDPLRNPDAAEVITGAVTAINAPTLVGALIQAPVDHLSNTSIVWRPGSGPGTGQDSVYVKRHPAPFGEYIPYRSFFRNFSDKVDLVQKDFISGDTLRDNPVGVLAMGRVRVGDVICFEVAYDSLVRDPVRQGATMLAVQTNNATFGRSAESVQQLAMSQLRAIENGRTVVHISTVGVSAIILPDGTVQQRSGHFRQEVLESDIPLRTSLTLATRVGVWPEAILAALGVALLIGGALAGRRRQGPSAPSGLREPRLDAPVTATVATAATAETKGLRGNDNGVRIRSA